MSKLLSNSSFGLLRTNPVLSSNVKLTILSDGKFELNSFDTGKLNQYRFKKFKTNSTSKWRVDLYNFWKGIAPDLIFEPYNPLDNEKISSKFEEQINNFYSYGAERVNSPLWKEEFKILAPLWIKDVLPTKFIIFKLKNPLDFKYSEIDINNFNRQDPRWFLNKDRLEVVKVFDLSENSEIGKYLINHRNSFISEPKPFFASFNQKKYSEYRGISLNSGSLVDIPEDIYSNLAINDSSQIEYDEFVTLGFKRNNIICNNLINFEFMFDDYEAKDFSMNRYLGLFVNENVDNQVEVLSFSDNNFYFKNEIDVTNFDSESSINYLKLSENNYKVIDKANPNSFITATNFTDKTPLFTNIERFDSFRENNGRDYISFKIKGQPIHGEEFFIEDIGKIIADFNIEAGLNIKNRFSTKGTTKNIASALSKAINFKSKDKILSISIEDEVICFSRTRFSYIGEKYKVFKSQFENSNVEITGKENFNYYNWINFNTGFDKVVLSSDIESLLEKEGKENIFVEAIDGTYHNIDFVFKFLDKPILNKDLVIGFENFSDFVSIQINYEKPLKLTNDGKLLLYKRAIYEKGRFSIFPIKDFDFNFEDSEEDTFSYYNKENYKIITDSGDKVLHPNFVDFVEPRKKWKIVDKKLDEISLIDNSYDRLDDNNNPRLSLKSKYSPYILKWVAGDNIVNKSYRLNNSESFGLLNGSPSFLLKEQIHHYYTHEWYDLGVYPDWINLNEKKELFQYYNTPFNLSEAISNLDEDIFTKYFTLEKIDDGLNQYPIKTRFRYSEFDRFNKTFYKGVSVKILERVENSTNVDFNINTIKLKETGKYDGYKFSSILIPETSEIAPKVSLEIIVNEKWKWVLFAVKINLNQDLDVLNDSGDFKVDYPILYLLKDKIRNLNENSLGSYFIDNKYYNVNYSDIFLSGFLDLNLNPGSRSEKISSGTVWDIVAFERDQEGSIPNLLTELNVDSNGLFKEIRLFSRLLLNSYQSTSEYIGVEVLDKISENSLKASRIYSNSAFSGQVDIINELGDLSLWSQRKAVYVSGGFNYFLGLLQSISFSSIKDFINLGYPEVKYKTILENGELIENNFLLKFESPDLIPKITSLSFVDADIPSNLSSEVKIGSKIVEKDNPFIIALERYSTYYEPKFKDIFNFVDSLKAEEHEKNKNLYFIYKDFVNEQFLEDKSDILENIEMQCLKVSNYTSKDLFIKSGKYPKINQTALFKRKVNIFTNNWDNNFYYNFYDKANFELLTQPTTKEVKNFFGSKMTKLQKEIIIESINSDYFSLEVKDNIMSISLDLKNAVVDYIYEKMKDYVFDYIHPSLNKEEFLRDYITNNLLNSYKLDSIDLWGRKTSIFDVYENTFSLNDLSQNSYKKVVNFLSNQENDFKINIKKDLLEENSFGVSVKYKLK